MNSPEAIAAIIAGVVSLIGIIINYIITVQLRRHERQMRLLEQKSTEGRLSAEVSAKQEEWQANLTAQEQQWQESFRAELRRNLTQESTLEVMRLRLKLYPDVWKALKITAGYEWRNLADQEAAVQELAHKLTDVAYSEIGLIMSDRSRRLLTHLRAGCGAFIRKEISGRVLIDRAYLLKHSMRGDLGIIDYAYESDLNEIAQYLGKVDDWTK